MGARAPLERHVSLWDFAVATYRRPAVEEVCLALQDDHGQCVPLLLWRLWALNRLIDATDLRRAVDVARKWETAVVAPLRSVRRELRESFPAVADDARLAMRERLKADELQAEHVLLESLDRLTIVGDGAPADAADALAELVAAWGGDAPAHVLARLAAAAASATG